MISIVWFVLLFIPGICDKPTVHAIETDACPPLLDIVFVLDTSGSIDEVYDEQIQWTKSLVEGLPISPTAVRIATIQYAGSPIVEFKLNGNKDKADVIQRLETIKFHSGVTRTGLALQAAEEELFSERNGARLYASKIIILFTDGLSIDDPNKPANHLRDVRGVNIYVVSVGTDGFVPEMQKIAGDVENVYGPSDLVRFKEHLSIDVEASRRCSTVSLSSSLPTKTPPPFRHHSAVTTTSTIPSISISPIATQNLLSNTNNKTTLATENQAIPKKRKRVRIVRRKLRRNGAREEIIINKAGKKVRRVIRRKIRTTKANNVTFSPTLPTPSASNSTSLLRKNNFRLITKKSTTPAVSTTTQEATTSVPISSSSFSSTTLKRESPVTVRFSKRTSITRIHPTLATEVPPSITSKATTSSRKELPRAFAAKNQVIPSDGECPMDVLFVVDSSGSVGAVYEKQKEFLSSILESINPEERSHRVALIQFAGARLQKIQWTFDSFSQNGEIMRAFNGLRHFTGTTYIGAALETTVTQLYTRRPNVPTLVIIISDGFSYDEVRSPAHRIRSMENVELFVASLAPLNNIQTLLEIAGDEAKLFTEDQVDILRTRLLNRFQCQS